MLEFFVCDCWLILWGWDDWLFCAWFTWSIGFFANLYDNGIVFRLFPTSWRSKRFWSLCSYFVRTYIWLILHCLLKLEANGFCELNFVINSSFRFWKRQSIWRIKTVDIHKQDPSCHLPPCRSLYSDSNAWGLGESVLGANHISIVATHKLHFCHIVVQLGEKWFLDYSFVIFSWWY